MEGLEWRLWRGSTPEMFDLTAAAADLVREERGDQTATVVDEHYDRVYHGGGLVAAVLERRLEEQGKSLDAIWRPLHREEDPVSPRVFLETLLELGGPDLASECREIVYGRRLIPSPAN